MPQLTNASALLAGLAWLWMSTPASAHEFWIDPAPVHPGVGGELAAELRVGENLSGAGLPYLDRTIAAMTHMAPTSTKAIASRLGDRPAIGSLSVAEPGLHILTVETHPAYVVFDTMQEFEDYLAYEGLSPVADLHRQRGLEPVEIAEEYIRNARALVQVGEGAATASDRPTGLPFELVVAGSPFALGRQSVSLRLTWEGDPEADTQVAMFYLPAGEAAPAGTLRRTARTDADGQVRFSAVGAGRYLFNAVRMIPTEGPGSVNWQSHWASLSFDIGPAD